MAKQNPSLINHNYGLRPAPPPPAAKRRHWLRWLLLALIAAGLVYGGLKVHDKPAKMVQQTTAAAVTTKSAPKKPVMVPSRVASSPCSGNKLSKLALVSISKRHFWACEGGTVAYDSAVVTGMEKLAADLTPTGTYHIYGKYNDLYLNGHDSTGSWHDYVYNWMPFLHNQYGSYGFHDATWRKADAFGNISPYSDQASHGCVEMPLAAADWLFKWAPVGTTVTIES